jgi:hypothetical protein
LQRYFAADPINHGFSVLGSLDLSFCDQLIGSKAGQLQPT